MDICDSYKLLKLQLQPPNLVVQKKLIDKTKNEEKVRSLEVVQVVLVQRNVADNQYQQKSEVFYS